MQSLEELKGLCGYELWRVRVCGRQRTRGGALSSAEYIIAGWPKLNIPDTIGGKDWEIAPFFVGQGHITPAFTRLPRVLQVAGYGGLPQIR